LGYVSSSGSIAGKRGEAKLTDNLTVKRRGRKRRRRNFRHTLLRAEFLEPRLLLTGATTFDHEFREDDFSIDGQFFYEMRRPETYNLIDRISSGQFTSTAGHIAWTSPREGSGFFDGEATGNGRVTVVYAGSRRGCANYGIEETGGFEFNIDAALSELYVVKSEATSTRHTYWNDLTGGQCGAPNRVASRFFAATDEHVEGTFDAAVPAVTITYSQPSPIVNGNANSDQLIWADSAPTDFQLTVAQPTRDIQVPQGWTTVPQRSVPPEYVFDASADKLELWVDVQGEPVVTDRVNDPVAKVRLFWAESDSDTSGDEIPINSNSGPMDLYWNSAKLHAVLEDFPEIPTAATHIRVTIETNDGVDTDATNNSKFLRILDLSARDVTGTTVNEDELLDRRAGSLLHGLDRRDPEVRVYAYDSRSELGVPVQVENDRGGYQYDPRSVPAIQALAAGETATDKIHFMAIEAQWKTDQATRSILVEGVNDPPDVGEDNADTTTYQKLSLLPATLLANDTDIDHGDTIELTTVDSVSQLGASVSLERDASQQQITRIWYEASTSEVLRQLAPGATTTDDFRYEVVDSQGAVTEGRVLVTVTGEDPVEISPVPAQMTTRDVPVGPIPLNLMNPNRDVADLQLVATSSNTSVVPDMNLNFGGSGANRTLTIQPAAGMVGRTWITLTASDPQGRSAETRFSLLVGLPDDVDLDGVPNDVEDAGPNGGDMNGDGNLDSVQGNVASWFSPDANAYSTLTVPSDHFLANVGQRDAPMPAGPAEDADFPMGLIHFEVIVDATGAVTTAEFQSDYAGPALNRYFQSDDDGRAVAQWQFLMHDGRDGARILSDRIRVTLSDGGRTDQDGNQDGKLVANAGLAHVDLPWKNVTREDVDNDGVITPVDVLSLVNLLNGVGPRFLGALPDPGSTIPLFVDPSGDNTFDLLDVLTIINYFHREFAGAGEAADDANPPGTKAVVPTSTAGRPSSAKSHLAARGKTTGAHMPASTVDPFFASLADQGDGEAKAGAAEGGVPNEESPALIEDLFGDDELGLRF
jgi:VCBS repeat-containing protein